MAFKSSSQRKAVMAKLRVGNTYIPVQILKEHGALPMNKSDIQVRVIRGNKEKTGLVKGDEIAVFKSELSGIKIPKLTKKEKTDDNNNKKRVPNKLIDYLNSNWDEDDRLYKPILRGIKSGKFKTYGDIQDYDYAHS